MLPMKPDLQKLIITDQEVIYHNVGEKTYMRGETNFGPIIGWAIVFSLPGLTDSLWLFLFFCLFWLFIFFCLNRLFFVVQILFEKWKSRTAFHIKKQVYNHNQIINNLHTLDQLTAIGNPVKINDIDAVIEALRITREGLIRALQTDRILRENPKFKPEYFNIDLSTLEAEKTTVKAIEYAQLLDDAVQIGVSVQKEMRKLQGKR